MSSQDAVAYKVLTGEEMAGLRAGGSFAGSSVDIADGFIHLSTAGQIDETVRKHFAGRENLAVAKVDLAMLGDAIRWEVSRGGQQFPHLYAPLPFSAVLAWVLLERDDQGKVILP